MTQQPIVASFATLNGFSSWTGSPWLTPLPDAATPPPVHCGERMQADLDMKRWSPFKQRTLHEG